MTLNLENLSKNNYTFPKRQYKTSETLKNINNRPVIQINTDKVLRKENHIFYVDNFSFNISKHTLNDLIIKLIALGIDAKLIAYSDTNIGTIPAIRLQNFKNYLTYQVKPNSSPYDLTANYYLYDNLEPLSEGEIKSICVFSGNEVSSSYRVNNKVFFENNSNTTLSYTLNFNLFNLLVNDNTYSSTTSEMLYKISTFQEKF